MTQRPGPPPFDLVEAEKLVGKYVLIGLTRYDADGELVGQEQLHGEVVGIDSSRGVRVSLGGEREGDLYFLPPDLRSWQEARPGSYRLRSTDEVVEDPDFLCTWVVKEGSEAGSG